VSQFYDRLPPEDPCAAPEGHRFVDVKVYGSPIPRHIICKDCGQLATVVVMEDE
jgi:hypothetical protein